MRNGWLIALALSVLILGAVLGWWLGRRPHSMGLPQIGSYHAETLAKVPKLTAVAATLDLGAALEQVIDHNAGLLPVVRDPRETRDALSAASVAHFGVDFLAVKRATVMAGEFGPAALLEGDWPGPLKGQAKGVAGSANVVEMAGSVFGGITRAGLVLGTEAAVRAVCETIAGNQESLVSAATSKASLARAGELAGPGAIEISISAVALPKVETPLTGGLESGAISVSAEGGLTLAVVGTAAAVERLAKEIEGGKEHLRAEVARQITNANAAENGGLALALVLCKHKLEDVLAYLEIARDGDALVVRLPGQGGAAVAAYLVAFGTGFGLRRSELSQPVSECERVLEHVATLFERDTTLPVEARSSVRASLVSESQRDKTLKECEALPKSQRDCMARAKDVGSVLGCASLLKEAPP